ncbi:MAG: RNA polymerase sigma factor [Acidimicrobiales bacterium]
MSNEREARFCELYDTTSARIVAYVMRRTTSREDAADAVAEVFAVTWRRLEDVPDGADAVLWLYVTARYVLAAQGRRRRRRDELTARLAGELEPAGWNETPDDDARLHALACLRSLPEADRELLMLAGWEGLCPTDIARMLDCSPAAARVRLHRARSRLRSSMSGSETSLKRTAQIAHELPGDRAVVGRAKEAFER